MRDELHGGIALAAGLALSGQSLDDFWFDYFGLGGTRAPDELVAYLADDLVWPRAEHDLAAQALNEHCSDLHLGWPTAYLHELRC